MKNAGETIDIRSTEKTRRIIRMPESTKKMVKEYLDKDLFSRIEASPPEPG